MYSLDYTLQQCQEVNADKQTVQTNCTIIPLHVYTVAHHDNYARSRLYSL